MNRFIRLLLIVTAVLLLTGGAATKLAVLAAPPPASITVFPTGLHPQDSLAVQAALDAVASPGTVILKSTNAGGTPMSFNFGGTDPGTGAVIKLLRPHITLAGDGWDKALNEPKTKIVGGGGAHRFSAAVSGVAMVFAVQAPGVTIRELKVKSLTAAYTAFYISSAVGQRSNDAPVVIERTDTTVMNYGILAVYTAPFPVQIRHNRFSAYIPVFGGWAGFGVGPISAYPFDEPVVPTDAGGAIVRHPFSVTDNVLEVEPGTDGAAIYIYGWYNAYSQSADPEVGVRRLRPNTSSQWTYQHVQGDNGPVLIEGNRIVIDSPDNYAAGIILASGTGGLNNSTTSGNSLEGVAAYGLEMCPYGHNNVIEGNDFSGLTAWQQVSIDAADTTLANNVFGPVVPLPPEMEVPGGLPQPAVALISVEYSPAIAPTPNPVTNCALVKNDYRLTGLTTGAVLVASQAELKWPFYFGTEVGGEVMNNLIFESGGFLPGTGQAGNQILLIAGMENPATGMPYVHDNRVIGMPARKIAHPGIGQIVHQILQLRRTPDTESRGR